MPRPLIQRRTEELLALFEEWQNQPAKLRNLLDELQHRNRPRAIELRKKIETALNNNAKPPEREQPLHTPPEANKATDKTEKAEAEREITGTPTRQSMTRLAQSRAEDSSYSSFTLIQPLGVQGRPKAFRPKLKNDLSLATSKNDPLVTIYRSALAELIREMKGRKIGHRQFTLEDGQLINSEADGFSYQFDFIEDGNLFEGAKIEIVIGGRIAAGRLTAILQGGIIVTLSDDFGHTIRTCTLRIDNTALIQALHDRLQKIENGEVTAFRSAFATKVLRNEGIALSSAPLPKRGTEKLNQKQQEFISAALANEITWLWGPPGTGKTKALAVLVRLLHDQGKRILICSNTNQAVDQVLLEVCRDIKKAGETTLDEGLILRLGNIECDDLRDEFEGFITAEGIVAKKSESLQRRKTEIEAELLRIGHEVTGAELILRQFAELDGAESTLKETRGKLTQAEEEYRAVAQSIRKAVDALAMLQSELATWNNAGTLRRIMLRSEPIIRRTLSNAEAQTAKLNADHRAIAARIVEQRTAVAQAEAAEQQGRNNVVGQNRDRLRTYVEECNKKRQPLRNELGQIATELGHILDAVLKNARIVGATVTRTYLRPTEFDLFDTVIIDEASMILLPAVFHAAGLATERVVVAGDFRQLPPIIQTEQKVLHDCLSPDVFSFSGIDRAAETGKDPRLVMLTEQFRMDESICRLVSDAFYGGRLTTSASRRASSFNLPEPFAQHITIIDTSRVWPFCTRNVFKSRFNLMHALAVRNLVLHFHDADKIKDADGRGTVGLCTPYAAQAKLLKKILKSPKLGLENIVRASTVHGFQGGEQTVVVLDLVDSIGEQNAGLFLQSNQPEDTGAKLLNVAFSRVKEALIVIANLTFLDAKLPSDSFLRGLLHDMQRTGRVVDVRDVLALRPIHEDLKRFGTLPELDPDALRTGLFTGREFAKLVRLDIEQAKESIVIFSGFVTSDRVAAMGDLLRQKLSDGIKVRCVTRPPRYNGSIPEANARAALQTLESMGVVVDLRANIHEKVVIVDGEISWFGSLNPLSHTAKTSELMARVEDRAIAQQLVELLSVRRRPADESAKASAIPENPRCEKCGNWSVLIRGKFGLFFACEDSECAWTQNVDAAHGSHPGQRSGERDREYPEQKCSKCGSTMRQRNGRFGSFYSCSKYPKCDGKADQRPRSKKKRM